MSTINTAITPHYDIIIMIIHQKRTATRICIFFLSEAKMNLCLNERSSFKSKCGIKEFVEATPEVCQMTGGVGGGSSIQSRRKIGDGIHAEGRGFEKEQVLMCHLRRGPNLPSVFQEIKAALCKNTETDGSH